MISLFPFFLFHFFVLSKNTKNTQKYQKVSPAWFDLTWDWGYLQGCCCDPTEILKVKIIKNSQFICLLCLEPSVWWYRGLPGYKSPMIPLCSGGLSGKKKFLILSPTISTCSELGREAAGHWLPLLTREGVPTPPSLRCLLGQTCINVITLPPSSFVSSPFIIYAIYYYHPLMFKFLQIVFSAAQLGKVVYQSKLKVGKYFLCRLYTNINPFLHSNLTKLPVQQLKICMQRRWTQSSPKQ